MNHNHMNNPFLIPQGQGRGRGILNHQRNDGDVFSNLVSTVNQQNEGRQSRFSQILHARRRTAHTPDNDTPAINHNDDVLVQLQLARARAMESANSEIIQSSPSSQQQRSAMLNVTYRPAPSSSASAPIRENHSINEQDQLPVGRTPPRPERSLAPSSAPTPAPGRTPPERSLAPPTPSPSAPATQPPTASKKTEAEMLKLHQPPSGNQLMDKLCCNFCGTFPRPPVRVCVKGHHICEFCVETMSVCPFTMEGQRISCSHPFIKADLLLYKFIFENSRIYCPYESSGCEQKPLGKDLDKHKAICIFRPFVECPVITCPIHHTSYVNYVQHVIEFHEAEVIEGHEKDLVFSVASIKCERQTNRFVGAVFKAYELDFALVIEADPTDLRMWISSMNNPDILETRSFEYSLALSRSKPRSFLQWDGEVYPRDKSANSIKVEQSCFSITKAALRKRFTYLDENKGELWNTKVDIREVEELQEMEEIPADNSYRSLGMDPSVFQDLSLIDFNESVTTEDNSKSNGENEVATSDFAKETEQTITVEASEPTTAETTQETERPTTLEATEETQEPTTAEPTQETEQPTTPEATKETDQPTTAEPTQDTEQPTTPESTEETNEPATAEPTQETEQPTTPEATEETDEPTTAEPTQETEQPTTPEATKETDEPTTAEHTQETEQPTTPEATEETDEPTTAEPTQDTEQSTTPESSDSDSDSTDTVINFSVYRPFSGAC